MKPASAPVTELGLDFKEKGSVDGWVPVLRDGDSGRKDLTADFDTGKLPF